MNILLLEDNIALNKAIRKSLALDKHIVDHYHDGQEVLDNIDTKKDLYLLDINVPNINGLELLDIIYSRDNSSKVMIISSNVDINSIKDAYSLGCIDYLRKPFHLEELRLKVNKHTYEVTHQLDTIELKVNHELTKKEKEFLALLQHHKNSIVTYDMIENSLYPDKIMSMDGLRALVKRLRAKLKKDLVQNVLDEGYQLNIQV